MKGSIRYLAAAVAATVSIGIIAAVVILVWPHHTPPRVLSQTISPELVARGRYVAAAAGCEACHSTEGRAALSGGRPFVLPFGTVYSTNITPDKATGLGGWTAGDFLRAMHDGVRADGSDLYPAFPYTAYHAMTDSDVLALWAYLATVPAVHAPAPKNSLRFPFNQRRLIRLWNFLFMPSDAAAGSGASGEGEVNRGYYLVNALTHCGECHTPRNLFYGLERGKALSGEVTSGWAAWNITSDRLHGIGDWSVEELVNYLRSGYAPGRAVASGPMNEIVKMSLSQLSSGDLRAMAIYLKRVPPSDNGPAVSSPAEAMASSSSFGPSAAEEDSRGRQIFAGACGGCHGWNGAGQQQATAALRGLRSVRDPTGLNVVQTILQGSSIVLPTGRESMPGFARSLSDGELSAVASFVTMHFGGQRDQISARDAHAIRTGPSG